MSSTVQVKGLSELLKNMEQLPRELVSKRGGLVRSALFKAAKTVRDEAKQRAPRDTGALQANVVTVRDKDPQATGASERYVVTVKKKRWTGKAKTKAKKTAGGKIDYRKSGDAFYWRFVEFGTSKMRAQPFLRPAFESQKDVALDEFKQSLATGIQRTVRKMHKGKP